MADNTRDSKARTTSPQRDEASEDLNIERITSNADLNAERDRIPSADDHNQELEREDPASRRKRGDGEGVTGEASEPTDPDSAESENDRDDMIDE